MGLERWHQSVYNVRKREVKKWKNIKHGQKKAHRDRFYFNWDFTDETLKDEFETYVGNVGEYTIRLSDHKRPPVVDGYAAYEQKYLYDARDKDTYDLAVKYLISALDKYCNEEIDVNELDSLLFNVGYDDLAECKESKK